MSRVKGRLGFEGKRTWKQSIVEKEGRKWNE